MARQLRRLILWLLAIVIALALVVAAALWWFIEPDRLRARLEGEASAVLGRTVKLHEPLRWKLGARIAIGSGAGEIGNLPAFGATPLASWKSVELGLALRPLLRREVRVDRIAIDGLALDLQRDAGGAVNWQLPARPPGAATATGSFAVDAVALRDAAIRYRDAATGADWQLRSLQLDVGLPADLQAEALRFADVNIAGVLSGGRLQKAGVPSGFSAPEVLVALPRITLPAFTAHWADARVEGALDAHFGDAPRLDSRIAVDVPSLRELLPTAGFAPPVTRDPSTLQALRLRAALTYADGGARISDLAISLDDTQLTGTVSAPSLSPLSLRFDLAADRVALDRYMKPENAPTTPLELPLADLRALDAKGVLKIERAAMAGVAARAVRLDVE